LRAILDSQIFPTFLRPNSWAPFSWLLRATYFRALWTIKVNFLVKKLGAVALNYLYLQKSTPGLGKYFTWLFNVFEIFSTRENTVYLLEGIWLKEKTILWVTAA
jgi:hypothetical protein